MDRTMIHMLTRAGEMALAGMTPSNTLLAFDFDGTLAPIVARADDAFTAPELIPDIRCLARRLPVAVVSGRAVRDLRKRLGFRPRVTAGNHGLETQWTKAEAARAARAVRSWIGQIDYPFDRDPGAYIENKVYSLSLHYRQALNPRRAERLLRVQALSLSPEARILPGHCLLNVVPKGRLNKGTALRLIMKKLGRPRALFVGDDDTDEDVFDLRDKKILGIRVGRTRRSRARFYLEDQSEMEQLLKILAARFLDQ